MSREPQHKAAGARRAPQPVIAGMPAAAARHQAVKRSDSRAGRLCDFSRKSPLKRATKLPSGEAGSSLLKECLNALGMIAGRASGSLIDPFALERICQ